MARQIDYFGTMGIAAADVQATGLSSAARLSDHRPLMLALRSKDRRRRRWLDPKRKTPIDWRMTDPSFPDQVEVLLGREPALNRYDPTFSATAEHLWTDGGAQQVKWCCGYKVVKAGWSFVARLRGAKEVGGSGVASVRRGASIAAGSRRCCSWRLVRNDGVAGGLVVMSDLRAAAELVCRVDSKHVLGMMQYLFVP